MDSMNKEELVRETQGKKAYQSPSLSVYGRVSHLTSSGSGEKTEGTSGTDGDDKGSTSFTIITYRS